MKSGNNYIERFCQGLAIAVILWVLSGLGWAELSSLFVSIVMIVVIEKDIKRKNNKGD